MIAGQVIVVVLTGVDEDLVVAGAQDRRKRGRLDELGTRSDDAYDPHGHPAIGAAVRDRRARTTGLSIGFGRASPTIAARQSVVARSPATTAR